MEGIPERVSLVILMTFTTAPSFLYWVRNIAAPKPKGIAMTRDNTIINSVLMIAGIMDTFSLLYFHWKSESLICGIPKIRTYKMIPANINKTMKAEIFNIIPMSLDFMFFIFSS